MHTLSSTTKSFGNVFLHSIEQIMHYLTKVQATNSTYWMSLKNGLNLGPSILAFVSKLQIRYCTTAQPKDFQKSGTIKLKLFLEPFVEVVLKKTLSTKIVRQYKHTLHTPYFPVHILQKSELCRMYVLIYLVFAHYITAISNLVIFWNPWQVML